MLTTANCALTPPNSIGSGNVVADVAPVAKLTPKNDTIDPAETGAVPLAAESTRGVGLAVRGRPSWTSPNCAVKPAALAMSMATAQSGLDVLIAPPLIRFHPST